MSETPNEIVTRWLDEGSAVLTTPPEIREAIRAVLARVKQLEEIDTQCVLDAESMRDKAWAERDALRRRVVEVERAAAEAVGADKVALITLREDANRRAAKADTLRVQAEAERDALRTEVERLRDAMAAFRSDRGRHEGQHDFTGGGIACVLCDKACIDAEAKLDEAPRDTAPEGFFARGEDGQYRPDPAPADHLSTEAEALAAMGAGQKLTKLREIEKP